MIPAGSFGDGAGEVTRLGVSAIPRSRYGDFAGKVPLVTAAITGTAAAGLTETQVVAGGQTIIITVTSDTWVASGAAFNAQRQNIIDGLDSAQGEATGWNAEVRDKLSVTAVVRTSDTVVTITLEAAPAYDVTADEVITVTVPASALQTSSTDVTGTPTIGITADVAAALDGGGGAYSKRKRRSKYPRRVSIGGRLYWVRNAEEERALLERHLAEVEAEALELIQEKAPKEEIAKARVRVVKAARRLDKVDTREAEWLDRLRQEDEEILMAVFH